MTDPASDDVVAVSLTSSSNNPEENSSTNEDSLAAEISALKEVHEARKACLKARSSDLSTDDLLTALNNSINQLNIAEKKLQTLRTNNTNRFVQNLNLAALGHQSFVHGHTVTLVKIQKTAAPRRKVSAAGDGPKRSKLFGKFASAIKGLKEPGSVEHALWICSNVATEDITPDHRNSLRCALYLLRKKAHLSEIEANRALNIADKLKASTH